MLPLPIGLALPRADARDVLSAVEEAEAEGAYAVWSTVGGPSPDALTIFAAAAVRTQSVRLGTSIVPAYPRHPIVLASQAMVLSDLVPGRFRLGVGPSHRPTIEGQFGISMGQPLQYMREYVTVLRQLLWEGTADFSGEYLHVHASLPEGRTPPRLPILLSALRPNAFRQAGALSDGAISWVCPPRYLQEVALPELYAGALQARRPVPPLVAHIPVAYTDNQEAGREIAREFLHRYAQLPFYARMFETAGHTVHGHISEELINDLAVIGRGPEVVQRLRSVLDGGAQEVLVSLLSAGDARQTQREFLRAVHAG